MALSRDKKESVVAEVSQLMDSSKLTVVATYQGTSVKAMQALRKSAREDGTQIRVVKNRLVRKAIEGSDKFKSLDVSPLQGQLMYVFNSEDEVAPAQAIANFAKTETQIEFVGAITSDGQLMSAEDVKVLAALPNKQQLRGMLVGTIAAPLTGFMRVMNGNLRGVMNVLNARAESL